MRQELDPPKRNIIEIMSDYIVAKGGEAPGRMTLSLMAFEFEQGAINFETAL
jgi:hypothetical protein